MHRTLIVARMRPGSAPDIAEIFADSDQTELPSLVGLASRSLFQFGDLYLHYIEGDEPVADAVSRVDEHPEIHRVSAALRPYVSAYDPEYWRGPRDDMGVEFYRWERPAPRW
jgi:cyclase